MIERRILDGSYTNANTLVLHTTKCVGCGEDLDPYVQMQRPVSYTGHLCTYFREENVICGWCADCTGGKFKPTDPECQGCYGPWSFERHGAVVVENP